MSIRALKWQDFSDGETLVVESAPDPAPPKPAEEQESIETQLAKARGKGRADGFAEGVAMAEARAETELRMVLSAISEQIKDADLINRGAHDQIVASVEKITSTLFRAIAPALSRSALLAEIEATVRDALQRVQASKLVVIVHPDRATQVAETLEREGLSIRIDEDADLSSLSARVHWQGGFDAIDLDHCIGSALEMLETHCAAAKAEPSTEERMKA